MGEFERVGSCGGVELEVVSPAVVHPERLRGDPGPPAGPLLAVYEHVEIAEQTDANERTPSKAATQPAVQVGVQMRFDVYVGANH